MKKYLILFLFLALGLFAGNWVFNHVNAWIGLMVIAMVTGVTFYGLFKLATKQKENEKESD